MLVHSVSVLLGATYRHDVFALRGVAELNDPPVTFGAVRSEQSFGQELVAPLPPQQPFAIVEQLVLPSASVYVPALHCVWLLAPVVPT